MPIKSPKAKGANGEREVAVLMTAWARQVGVNVDLVRNLEQTRGGGHDLLGLEAAYALAVEVKRVESPNVTAWWRQAVRQAEAVNCDPVLAHRMNRQPWRFRVRVWVYPALDKLDVDMECGVFQSWFKARLTKCPTM